MSVDLRVYSHDVTCVLSRSKPASDVMSLLSLRVYWDKRVNLLWVDILLRNMSNTLTFFLKVHDYSSYIVNKIVWLHINIRIIIEGWHRSKTVKFKLLIFIMIVDLLFLSSLHSRWSCLTGIMGVFFKVSIFHILYFNCMHDSVEQVDFWTHINGYTFSSSFQSMILYRDFTFHNFIMV